MDKFVAVAPAVSVFMRRRITCYRCCAVHALWSYSRSCCSIVAGVVPADVVGIRRRVLCICCVVCARHHGVGRRFKSGWCDCRGRGTAPSEPSESGSPSLRSSARHLRRRGRRPTISAGARPLALLAAVFFMQLSSLHHSGARHLSFTTLGVDAWVSRPSG